MSILKKLCINQSHQSSSSINQVLISLSSKKTINKTTTHGNVKTICRMGFLEQYPLILNKKKNINVKPNNNNTMILDANILHTITKDIKNGWKNSIL